jgi:hypothetical protein
MPLPVSPEWIVESTRRYVAEHSKTHLEIAKFIELVDALPLYQDMGGGVAMRADGELIGFIWDEPQSIKPETDPHLRFLALVSGAERYPELSSLSPQRTENDRDCSICRGTGPCWTLKRKASTPHIFVVIVAAPDGCLPTFRTHQAHERAHSIFHLSSHDRLNRINLGARVLHGAARITFAAPLATRIIPLELNAPRITHRLNSRP